MLSVSFVVPLYKPGPEVDEVIDAILAQDDGRPFEVILVDDAPECGRAQGFDLRTNDPRVRLIAGPKRGAAAALNEGLRSARHDVICQVDQDVVIGKRWMRRLVEQLETHPKAGAVQGYYATNRSQPWLARVMGYDLEERYSRIAGDGVDHVCTGNSAYRAKCLEVIGGFDEALGYGYDNDASYRLSDAGFSLRFVREARSTHHWRASLGEYLRQQYGVGYGRLDVVWKHLRRLPGDQVSDWRMLAHVPLMALALGLVVIAALSKYAGLQSGAPTGAAWMVLGLLFLERGLAGAKMWRRTRDAVCLFLPWVHVLRDVAWVFAAARWAGRRAMRRASVPSDSMS
jgi:cellulose synthase/poly-beta-1,6-N-acetylglucosamine synthase-like glycosyltransferase